MLRRHACGAPKPVTRQRAHAADCCWRSSVLHSTSVVLPLTRRKRMTLRGASPGNSLTDVSCFSAPVHWRGLMWCCARLPQRNAWCSRLRRREMACTHGGAISLLKPRAAAPLAPHVQGILLSEPHKHVNAAAPQPGYAVACNVYITTLA
jgi:hypothetical protein